MSINPEFPQPPLLIPLRSLPNVNKGSGNISHGIVFPQQFNDSSICSAALSSLSQVPFNRVDESLTLFPTSYTNHQLLYSSNHVGISPTFHPENISHLQLLQDPNVNFDFEQQRFASYSLGDGATPNVDTSSGVSVSDPSITRNMEFCVSGPFTLDCTPLFIQGSSSSAGPVASHSSVATASSPAAPPVWSTNSLLNPHTTGRSRRCTISIQEVTRRSSAPEFYGLPLLKAYLRFSNNRWASERDRVAVLLERELNVASKHQPLVSAFTRLSEADCGYLSESTLKLASEFLSCKHVGQRVGKRLQLVCTPWSSLDSTVTACK